MTDTTQPAESGFLSGLTDTFSVIFGSTTITPTIGHTRWALAMGLVIGWIAGIWRKTTKPEVNMLGF